MQILVEIITVTAEHFNIILQNLGLYLSHILTPNTNHFEAWRKACFVCSLLPEPSFPRLNSSLHHEFKHKNHIWVISTRQEKKKKQN